MDDIMIDRLVLDIPGLTVDQARKVSEQVGAKLADAAPRDAPPQESDFGTLTVDLNDEAISRNLPRLADMIVDSILRQIG
jgi:hypothetical protein